jgi:hypothetical protein
LVELEQSKNMKSTYFASRVVFGEGGRGVVPTDNTNMYIYICGWYSTWRKQVMYDEKQVNVLINTPWDLIGGYHHR